MKVKIIDDIPKTIYDLVVFKFTISDGDDPDLHVAEILSEWEHSESGRWVVDHAVEIPRWYRNVNVSSYSYEFLVKAQMFEEDVIYFKLKWS